MDRPVNPGGKKDARLIVRPVKIRNNRRCQGLRRNDNVPVMKNCAGDTAGLQKTVSPGITAEINAPRSGPFVKPVILVVRRQLPFRRMFGDKGDGFGRTGCDAQAATNASFVNNTINIVRFHDGADLTPLLGANAATGAFIRIDLRVVIGFDQRRRVQVPPEGKQCSP